MQFHLPSYKVDDTLPFYPIILYDFLVLLFHFHLKQVFYRHFCIVVNLCAIVSVVLPFASLSSDLETKYSLSLSRADVASSKINILGFLRIL